MIILIFSAILCIIAENLNYKSPRYNFNTCLLLIGMIIFRPWGVAVYMLLKYLFINMIYYNELRGKQFQASDDDINNMTDKNKMFYKFNILFEKGMYFLLCIVVFGSVLAIISAIL